MELNYPLLRSPFEQANKVFRLYHKQLSRELSTITGQIEALDEAQHPAHRMDVDAAIAKLATIADAIQSLKRDAGAKVKDQENSLETCVKRAAYLTECDAQDKAAKLQDTTPTTRYYDMNDRLIADYLLRQGLFESSKLVQDSKDVGYLVDDGLYKECHALLLDLQAHNTANAIAWCAQNGSRLRRLQSPLEFRLRLQEVVECIRSNKRLEAIQYAQTYLTPLAMQQENEQLKQAQIQDVQAAMTALAFESPETCGFDTYAKLFANDRWSQLVDMFRSTFFEVYGIHNPPSLTIALHTGLSTLNTRTCRRVRDAQSKKKLARTRSASEEATFAHEEKSESDGGSVDLDSGSQSYKKPKLNSGDNDNRTARSPSELAHTHSEQSVPVCPTCSEVGSQLCSTLPFAYHPHSRLVCRVTHNVMDENNPPVVLPNGRVYSRQGIDQLAQRSQDGMIKCLDTQEVFAASDVKPVYIL